MGHELLSTEYAVPRTLATVPAFDRPSRTSRYFQHTPNGSASLPSKYVSKINRLVPSAMALLVPSTPSDVGDVSGDADASTRRSIRAMSDRWVLFQDANDSSVAAPNSGDNLAQCSRVTSGIRRQALIVPTSSARRSTRSLGASLHCANVGPEPTTLSATITTTTARFIDMYVELSGGPLYGPSA